MLLLLHFTVEAPPPAPRLLLLHQNPVHGVDDGEKVEVGGGAHDPGDDHADEPLPHAVLHRAGKVGRVVREEARHEADVDDEDEVEREPGPQQERLAELLAQEDKQTGDDV